LRKRTDGMLSSGIKHVHFIGIGGYGMSALAAVLLQMGYRVSGSDIKASGITEKLRLLGSEIYIGHHPQNPGNCDLVVYSTAIPDDNHELKEASRRFPLWHRSQLLAALINSHYGIAVAGTHGKTTTTAMLTLLLEHGGLDPTAVIGGEVENFHGNARLGSSRYLVAEACESDNSFLRYRPTLTVVTNVEPEHLDYYDGSFDKLKDAYRVFMHHTREEGSLVLNAEDPFLRELYPTIDRDKITYALEGSEGEHFAHLVARQIQSRLRGTRFLLYYRGRVQGRIELSVPGRYNVSNALAAMAATAQLGLDPVKCADILPWFNGAGRRFEVLGDISNITLVDDYAHHPTEIKATLEAARSICGVSGGPQKGDRSTGPNGRVIALFQPHRYSRTSFFLDDFARSFGEADIILVHRVFPAGEKPLEGADGKTLSRLIRNQEKDKPVYFIEDISLLTETAVNLALPGDIIITMGAGDIWKAAQLSLKMLQETRGKPGITSSG